VWYCSAECSKKDWTQQHRQECKDWVGVKEAEEREVEND